MYVMYEYSTFVSIRKARDQEISKPDRSNPRWRGLFKTREQAISIAEKTGKTVVIDGQVVLC